MKNTFKIFSAMFFFSALLIFTSCSEDDSVVLEEEVTKTEMVIEVRGTTITTDAVASYCSSNGKEFIGVANKESFLDYTQIEFGDFVPEDFVFNLVNDGENAYTLGGTVFAPEVAGGITTFSSTPDISYTVSSNDGTTISGFMEGDFLVFDSSGGFEFVPYTVTFNALIVETSTFCD